MIIYGGEKRGKVIRCKASIFFDILSTNEGRGKLLKLLKWPFKNARFNNIGSGRGIIYVPKVTLGQPSRRWDGMAFDDIKHAPYLTFPVYSFRSTKQANEKDPYIIKVLNLGDDDDKIADITMG